MLLSTVPLLIMLFVTLFFMIRARRYSIDNPKSKFSLYDLGMVLSAVALVVCFGLWLADCQHIRDKKEESVGLTFGPLEAGTFTWWSWEVTSDPESQSDGTVIVELKIRTRNDDLKSSKYRFEQFPFKKGDVLVAVGGGDSLYRIGEVDDLPHAIPAK